MFYHKVFVDGFTNSILSHAHSDGKGRHLLKKDANFWALPKLAKPPPPPPNSGNLVLFFPDVKTTFYAYDRNDNCHDNYDSNDGNFDDYDEKITKKT